jgi:DNA-directed RNA polymerase subunit K/omega
MEDFDMLMSNTQNKFLLTNAIAGRAKQVSEGSLPYVDNFDPSSPIVTAMREIAADKIRIKVLSKPSAKLQEAAAEGEEFKSTALERLAREKKGHAVKKEKKKKK